MDNLFSVNQAAFILKVHPLTIRRYIKEGRLKAIKAGGNIRIKEADLQGFNKEFEPKTPEQNSSPFKRLKVSKVFTVDDPFFRLEGRGARVIFSK